MKVLDGTEHCAHVLFTELVKCERDGDIFYTAAKSRDYQRSGAMTAEYVRELITTLGRLLAEYDAERGNPFVFDGIDLQRLGGDKVSFALLNKGDTIASGIVTEAVARKAKSFLDGMFDPPKVVRLRHGALVLALVLAPFADLQVMTG